VTCTFATRPGCRAPVPAGHTLVSMTSGDSALAAVRGAVDQALSEFLQRQRAELLAAGQELMPAVAGITGLLAAGKRLRPAFCYWGWRGAGGPDCPQILTAAAALELLHAGALVHDDVMDGSDTRRGQPSLHRQFESLHDEQGWRGPAAGFGTGAAILVGDLLLCWTDAMLHGSGLPADTLARGQPVLDLMRTEVFAGQYLDLLGQAAGDGTVDSALRVVEYKTAKYTIERPLQLGAALAGPVSSETMAAYTAYGLPLGIAFQLRDDVLGVFGDPGQTGKPAGDDLREGKRTVLLAIARARASGAQAAVLDSRLGDPLLDEAGMAQVRDVITETGALTRCERMISDNVTEALAAVAAAPINPEAKAALAELAVAATTRHD
jgi:geranylgeranyl diphosphate synthase, type I